MRKSLVVLALAGALAMTTALTPAFAQTRSDVKVGLVLEPPSLDPTAEAACNGVGHHSAMAREVVTATDQPRRG